MSKSKAEKPAKWKCPRCGRYKEHDATDRRCKYLFNRRTARAHGYGSTMGYSHVLMKAELVIKIVTDERVTYERQRNEDGEVVQSPRLEEIASSWAPKWAVAIAKLGRDVFFPIVNIFDPPILDDAPKVKKSKGVSARQRIEWLKAIRNGTAFAKLEAINQACACAADDGMEAIAKAIDWSMEKHVTLMKLVGCIDEKKKNDQEQAADADGGCQADR